MHVAIDAHSLGKGIGGVERVVRMLVERIPALLPNFRFTLLLNRRYTLDFATPANVSFHRLKVDDPLVQRSVLLPVLARRLRFDLLHVQRIAPPFSGCRVLTHIHDLLPLTAPEDHPSLRDAIVRWLTPGTLRRSNHILTVSESVKQEIARLYPQTHDKITAVPNGIFNGHFVPSAQRTRQAIHQRLGLTGEYVFYLGAISPRKNLELMIRGWAEYLKIRPQSPLKLAIAGMSRDRAFSDRIKRLTHELGLDSTIVWAGFTSESESLSLLQQARLFLAPSRGEGFDLPALEAMACGTPVLCSELPVHRELLGEAAHYFDVHSVPSFAAALAALESEFQRRHLASIGLAQAARYDWDRAAEGVAELYRQITSVSQLNTDVALVDS